MTALEAREKLKRTFGGSWESTEHRFAVPTNENVRIVIANFRGDWTVGIEDYKGDAGWLRQPKFQLACRDEADARRLGEDLWRKLIAKSLGR